jgi:hypothetical protein
MTKTQAKRTLTGLSMAQRGVFHLLKSAGPLTDTELVELYPTARRVLDRGHRYPEQRPSGIRTRRNELVARGAVIDTGERVRLPGSRRASTIWRAL